MSALQSGQKALQVAEDAIAADQYDIEAWQTVLVDVEIKRDIDKTRATLERFLKVFPTAAKYWKYYIEQEIAAKNFDRVERLFPRCLFQCLDVDLWKTYIKYIKIVKSTEAKRDEAIDDAYKYVLRHVGQDVHALPIWSEHISFLKKRKADNAFEISQKITAIRSVFQKAITTPMVSVEQLWREYDIWENSHNKQLAKNLIPQMQSLYTLAKRTCTGRKALRAMMVTDVLARPPRDGKHSQDRDYKQVEYWRKLIEFEAENPQDLSTEALHARIVFTYQQALMTLRHFPEMWLEYIGYLEKHSVNEAEKVFESALEAMSYSQLIHFLFAEFLERHKKFKEARELFENLEEKHPSPLVYIHFMRFVRRTEDKKAARNIFMRARKSPKVSYHIFIAAAQMEYLKNKEPKVATKVFNFGLTDYIRETDYVLAYIDFLEHQNDHSNLRTVFERALAEIPDHTASPSAAILWDKFVRWNRHVGDLDTSLRAESRMAEALQHRPVNKSLDIIQRYSFLDLLPCQKALVHTLERARGGGPSILDHRRALSSSSHHGTHSLLDNVNVKGNVGAKTDFVKPDLAKMVCFMPNKNFLRPPAHNILNCVPPGVQMPDLANDAKWSALKDVLEKLPPPQLVQGIDIDIDALIALFMDKSAKQLGTLIATSSDQKIGFKRKADQGDLYRQRQAKKANSHKK